MAKKSASKAKASGASKQRTREHVIASLSVNYVERAVYEQGYSAERVQSDYGYDLAVTTFDSQGYVEPGCILLQLKATDNIQWVAGGSELSFAIEAGDCRTWLAEAYPVFLIVFDAHARKAYWLYLQKYFGDYPDRVPAPGIGSVAVRIPASQILDNSTIAYMRAQKQTVMAQYVEVKHG